jgi:hypothetical protein
MHSVRCSISPFVREANYSSMWCPQIANELTTIDPLVSDLGWGKGI